MILTDEQQRELDLAPGAVARLIDPRTNVEYVVVRSDVYERIEQLLAIDPRDAYPALDEAFREGWSDPKMADYDDYEARELP
jgi:hypothetical protein